MEGVWMDTARFPVSRGDLLVLCSDGLTDAVPANDLHWEMAQLWKEKRDPAQATTRLTGIALAAGGPDNVTIVVVRVGSFSRGRGRARLGFTVTVGVFVALAALVASANLPLVQGDRPTTLPVTVNADKVLHKQSAYHPPPGSRTVVNAGRRLDLRGVVVSGTDWSVEVGDGATLAITRSAIELTGALDIRLGSGSTLEIVDGRIDAMGIRVLGPEGSVVSLAHATLRASTRTGVRIEGAAKVIDEDSRRIEPEPEPEPDAMPPEDGTAP